MRSNHQKLGDLILIDSHKKEIWASTSIKQVSLSPSEMGIELLIRSSSLASHWRITCSVPAIIYKRFLFYITIWVLQSIFILGVIVKRNPLKQVKPSFECSQSWICACIISIYIVLYVYIIYIYLAILHCCTLLYICYIYLHTYHITLYYVLFSTELATCFAILCNFIAYKKAFRTLHKALSRVEWLI